MVAKCFQADGLQSYLFSCCLHPQKRYHLALFKILNGFYHEQAMIQQMDSKKIVEQKRDILLHTQQICPSLAIIKRIYLHFLPIMSQFYKTQL